MTAQLSVTLDQRLITALKRRALDSDLSLSALLNRICSGYLGDWQQENPESDDHSAGESPDAPEDADPSSPDLLLQPLVHVHDLAGTVTWLAAALLSPLKLNACPATPGVNATPFTSVPLFAPRLSLAVPSAW